MINISGGSRKAHFVGEEFWFAFPLGPNSAGYQDRFLYRAISQSKNCVKLVIEGVEVEVLRHQRRPMTGIIKFVQLADRVVPDYEFGEWEEVSHELAEEEGG